MICASRNGYTKIVQLLLAKKSNDIKFKNILKSKFFFYYVLKLIFYSSHLKYLMIYLISFLTFNNASLLSAVTNGHIEIVRLLLKEDGIDINFKNILNPKKF